MVMVMAQHPEDVIDAILLWLPVKSLMRFKCVGKSWCALIRNPYFVEQYSSLRPDATHLLISYPEYGQTILDGEATSDHTLPNILEHGPYFDMSSCCDGLISMHPVDKAKGSTFVYNPNTREALSIPFNANAFKSISVRSFIGFEPVSNQYKLMLLDKVHKYNSGSVHGEIITLGGGTKNNWRQVIINGTTPLLLAHGPSTCFNGALHWLTNSHTQPITVFDLESEKFGEIPGPKRIQESPWIVFYLCQVGGRLTLTECGTYGPEASLELWTVKDYYNGVWVKQTLNVSVPLSSEYIGDRLHVVGGMNNDEIIVCIGLEPFGYDMKTKKGRKINVGGEHDPVGLKGIVLCTESMRCY